MLNRGADVGGRWRGWRLGGSGASCLTAPAPLLVVVYCAPICGRSSQVYGNEQDVGR